MRKLTLLLTATLLGLTSTTFAGPVTYDVTVNTSSISGTQGSLDLNFNPGPLVTQSETLQILNFSSNGSLADACPCSTGNVTGQLPSTLTFNNTTSFNDYFDQFKYGSTLSFEVSLYGPALSTPGNGATSGSTFAFSMFSDSLGTVPTLTTNTSEGFALTIATNLDGTTTVNNYSSQTSIKSGVMKAPEIDPASAISALTLLFGCLAVLSARRTPIG